MTKSIWDLTGHIALITGASSGLGEHFSHVLAAAGAKVIVASRRSDRLSSVVDAINNTGGNATSISMDVTDTASVIAGFSIMENEVGLPDILINNAGVARSKTFLHCDEDDWEYVMRTNLKAAWHVARIFSGCLVKNGKTGSIVNISSILGLGVGYGEGLYSISKAGMVQMTKSMALELIRHRIRVNALCPGYFETELNSDYFRSERGQAYIENKMPSKRLGRLSELDGPLLLLASEAGSFMTGVALPVDGGHLVHSL